MWQTDCLQILQMSISQSTHKCILSNIYDCDPTDRYQAVGRKVYMDYVQEQLKTEKKVDLGDSQERSNDIDIEILADTVYVKVS